MPLETPVEEPIEPSERLEQIAEETKEIEYPTKASRFATYFLVALAIIAVATVTIAVIISIA